MQGALNMTIKDFFK